MEDERNWFVGVDWASKTHHVRVSDAKGRKVGERAFAHGGQGLAEMAAWILKSTGATPDAVFVAIEVPHGPVVESLMERGFRVHAINPKQLDRFRDRFSPAGAKDDSRDAEVLADALRTDPHCCRHRLVISAAGFWLATVGFLVNWFGDSLDGSLARFRGVESPRYGYFLDHSADAVSSLLILVGLGFSAYMHLDVALSVLVSYFLMCIYVFVQSRLRHLSNILRGPTELRIGLIIMNLWMFVSGPSKFAILGQTFSVYDLVFSLVAVTLVCLFVVSMLQAVRRLRREDCPAVLSKTRYEISQLQEQLQVSASSPRPLRAVL